MLPAALFSRCALCRDFLHDIHNLFSRTSCYCKTICLYSRSYFILPLKQRIVVCCAAVFTCQNTPMIKPLIVPTLSILVWFFRFVFNKSWSAKWIYGTLYSDRSIFSYYITRHHFPPLPRIHLPRGSV